MDEKLVSAKEVNEIMIKKALNTLPHGIIPRFLDRISESKIIRWLYWGD